MASESEKTMATNDQISGLLAGEIAGLDRDIRVLRANSGRVGDLRNTGETVWDVYDDASAQEKTRMALDIQRSMGPIFLETLRQVGKVSKEMEVRRLVHKALMEFASLSPWPLQATVVGFDPIFPTQGQRNVRTLQRRAKLNPANTRFGVAYFGEDFDLTLFEQGGPNSGAVIIKISREEAQQLRDDGLLDLPNEGRINDTQGGLLHRQLIAYANGDIDEKEAVPLRSMIA